MAFINLGSLRLPFQTAGVKTTAKKETVIPEKKETTETTSNKKESYVNTVRTPGLALSFEQSSVLAQQTTMKLDLSNVSSQQNTAVEDNNSKTQESDSVGQMTEKEAIAQGYTVIKTAEDLEKINDNLNGKYILMGDIDLSGLEKYVGAFGTEENPFTGVFNGNGYTISNLDASWHGYDYRASGLFGYADGAEFSNITFKDPVVHSGTIGVVHNYEDAYKSAGGALVAFANNCTITNCNVEGTMNNGDAAGIAGWITNTVVSDCHVNIDGKANAGIVGIAEDSVIENCSAKLNGMFDAGIVNYATDTEIKNCTTSGNIKGKAGIAGSTSGNSTVSNCSSSANITSVYSYAPGGIVGTANDNTTIDSCDYSGDISGAQIGGIAAYAEGNTTIKNCSVNNANIKSRNLAGGIVGRTPDDEGKVTIEDCKVENTNIEGHNALGGILGSDDGNAAVILDGCEVDNITINGIYDIGGIVGSSSTTLIDGDEAIKINDCEVKNSTLQGVRVVGGIGNINTDGATNLLTDPIITVSEDCVQNVTIKDKDGNIQEDLPDVGEWAKDLIGKILGSGSTDYIEYVEDNKTYKFPDLIDMVQDKKDMEAAAKKQNLTESNCNGVYQKRINGKTVFYVWNSNDKEFELAADIQSINSDGTYTDRYGNKYNKPYNEQVAAHAGGYTPTVVEGVYEKDGKYYSYNNGLGEFVEIDKSNFEVETPDTSKLYNNKLQSTTIDLGTSQSQVTFKPASSAQYRPATAVNVSRGNEDDDSKKPASTQGVQLSFNGFVSLNGYSNSSAQLRKTPFRRNS